MGLKKGDVHSTEDYRKGFTGYSVFRAQNPFCLQHINYLMRNSGRSAELRAESVDCGV